VILRKTRAGQESDFPGAAGVWERSGENPNV